MFNYRKALIHVHRLLMSPLNPQVGICVTNVLQQRLKKIIKKDLVKHLIPIKTLSSSLSYVVFFANPWFNMVTGCE